MNPERRTVAEKRDRPAMRPSVAGTSAKGGNASRDGANQSIILLCAASKLATVLGSFVPPRDFFLYSSATARAAKS